MIDSGPVREPPRPETPKLLVPILRSLAKVRKVSCTNTLPAFTCSAMRQRLLLAAGDHRSGEPELRIVGERDRLFDRAEAHHRQDRPEGLLPHQPHRVIHVGHHGGPHVQPAAERFGDAAREHLRALRHCILQMRFDDLAAGARR